MKKASLTPPPHPNATIIARQKISKVSAGKILHSVIFIFHLKSTLIILKAGKTCRNAEVVSACMKTDVGGGEKNLAGEGCKHLTEYLESNAPPSPLSTD